MATGDFAQKLGLVLKAINLSRGRLAQAAGVDKSVVSRWASGVQVPSDHNLSLLTDAVARQRPGFGRRDWDLDAAGFANRLDALDAGASSLEGPSIAVGSGYVALDVSDDTSWDEFVSEFVALSSADVTDPVLVIDDFSNDTGPTPAAPATIDLTIVGNDVIDIQGWVMQDVGGGFIDLLGAISQDEAQPGQTQVQWDGQLIALSDGTNVSALPLFPVEPGGCNVAFAFVQYRETPAAPDQQLLMLMDCASGTVLGYFGAIPTANGEIVGAVTLRPGSELEVLFIRIDTADSSADLVPGITLSLPGGASSLDLVAGPAGPGEYVFVAIVSDIAGNTSLDGIDVTVP